jgi:hypothetical protein
MLKFDTAYYKRFYGDNGAHDAGLRVPLNGTPMFELEASR